MGLLDVPFDAPRPVFECRVTVALACLPGAPVTHSLTWLIHSLSHLRIRKHSWQVGTALPRSIRAHRVGWAARPRARLCPRQVSSLRMPRGLSSVPPRKSASWSSLTDASAVRKDTSATALFPSPPLPALPARTARHPATSKTERLASPTEQPDGSPTWSCHLLPPLAVGVVGKLEAQIFMRTSQGHSPVGESFSLLSSSSSSSPAGGSFPRPPVR